MGDRGPRGAARRSSKAPLDGDVVERRGQRTGDCAHAENAIDDAGDHAQHPGPRLRHAMRRLTRRDDKGASMVPFDGCDQTIAGRGRQQRVIDDGKVDLAARENSHCFRRGRGFCGYHASLASAQLLKQPDAQERRRRRHQHGAHFTAAVLR